MPEFHTIGHDTVTIWDERPKERWSIYMALGDLPAEGPYDSVGAALYNARVRYGELIRSDLCSCKVHEYLENSYRLEHSDVHVVNVHKPEVCEGQPCTVHHKTDHTMRSMPQHWRTDRSMMERICNHGVGHPDPDNPWPDESPMWVHNCDGCCLDPPEGTHCYACDREAEWYKPSRMTHGGELLCGPCHDDLDDDNFYPLPEGWIGE